jgi:hypothetical protein
MSTRTAILEFRAVWLPNVSDSGLSRIISLLESASPYLIHGSFAKSLPMGCLASHIAWNHPKTARFQDEAGIQWLCKVARLNPATSHLVMAWDQSGLYDHDLRFGLLDACYAEQALRADFAETEPLELCALA